jgi:hypothetical protein
MPFPIMILLLFQLHLKDNSYKLEISILFIGFCTKLRAIILKRFILYYNIRGPR